MSFDMNMMQQMQARMAQIQQELGETTVTGSAGGGVVTCEVTGLQEVKGIAIAPEAVDPSDISVLEDLVLLAVRDALARAKDLAAQRMSELTGGLNIPGLS